MSISDKETAEISLKLYSRPILILAQEKEVPEKISNLDGAIMNQRLEGLPKTFP